MNPTIPQICTAARDEAPICASAAPSAGGVPPVVPPPVAAPVPPPFEYTGPGRDGHWAASAALAQAVADGARPSVPEHMVSAVLRLVRMRAPVRGADAAVEAMTDIAVSRAIAHLRSFARHATSTTAHNLYNTEVHRCIIMPPDVFVHLLWRYVVNHDLTAPHTYTHASGIVEEQRLGELDWFLGANWSEVVDEHSASGGGAVCGFGGMRACGCAGLCVRA